LLMNGVGEELAIGKAARLMHLGNQSASASVEPGNV